MAILKTYTPPGGAVAFDIHVNEGGQFEAVLDGQRVAHDYRLADLEETLTRRSKEAARASRTQVKVPVLREDGNRLEEGVAYGIHAGTGNLMVRWPSGTKQYGRYEQLLKAAMPADVRTRFNELLAAKAELETLRQTWRTTTNEIDRIVREAMAAEGS